MKLPTVEEVDKNKRVILRLDMDVPCENGIIENNSRLVKSIPTIRMLLSKGCRIIVVGHLGRPRFIADSEGNFSLNEEDRTELSLKPIYVELMSLLEEGEDIIDSVFTQDINNKEILFDLLDKNQIVFLENIRFIKGETDGEVSCLNHLAEVAEVFVNDSLAVAHRRSASMQLFKLMPVYYGLGFAREVELMFTYLINLQRPSLLVLGGTKEDKLDNLPVLAGMIDEILVGGKLPIYKHKHQPIDNVSWAELDESGKDINKSSIDKFVEKIGKARTIILTGSMGVFEEEEHQQGTVIINRAIANSGAIKIGGGGDTKFSLEKSEVEDRFDFICSGGGVLLEFLAKKGKLTAWDESRVSL